MQISKAEFDEKSGAPIVRGKIIIGAGQTELNFTNQTSQQQIYNGLPSGDVEIVNCYGGLNNSGALYKRVANDNQPEGALLLRRAA